MSQYKQEFSSKMNLAEFARWLSVNIYQFSCNLKNQPENLTLADWLNSFLLWTEYTDYKEDDGKHI